MRFVEFARVCGIDIRRLRDDGKIHRCPTLEHPRSDNGAYAFDGKRGWCMAWDAGGETHWYGADPKEWTPEERAAWKDRQRAEYQAKLAGCTELHRYVFFASPMFPGTTRLPKLELGGVQVWSVDV